MVAGPGFEPRAFLVMSQASRHCSIPASYLAAAARVELASARLQDERSVYPIELRRKKCLVDQEGLKPSSNSLQDCRFVKLSY